MRVRPLVLLACLIGTSAGCGGGGATAPDGSNPADGATGPDGSSPADGSMAADGSHSADGSMADGGRRVCAPEVAGSACDFAGTWRLEIGPAMALPGSVGCPAHRLSQPAAQLDLTVTVEGDRVCVEPSQYESLTLSADGCTLTAKTATTTWTNPSEYGSFYRTVSLQIGGQPAAARVVDSDRGFYYCDVEATGTAVRIDG